MIRHLGTTGKYLSLVLGSLVALVPIIVILFASLKSNTEYATTGPLVPPSNWFNFANFATAFVDGRMMLGFLNTSIIAVISVTGTILIGTMAAYVLDRFEFRFKKVVFGLFLVATLVPAVTTQVATYQVVNFFHLVNTHGAAIILFMGTDILSIYIFIQFMQSIPRSLDEAAMLDGASRFGVYWRIILPLLGPAIATVVIIKGIAIYNEFYIPYLYMPAQDLAVISTSLFRFQGPYGAQWEIIAAGIMIVIVPTLIIFLFLQRFIYNGVTSGATK
ncbi:MULTISPECIES: carbohydrate ABC transporter permease [Cryobacterium]|uniref:Carbohydrate ABC transporter permease n=1 Tax=Cryobacterium zongtaii TaxID=1259217 RepID=A0A2S3Z784_9MICO|nr:MULTISPECIES: carbohydrate ABC transporter permease [Cryobacterium]ASD21911.1 sugar ABC transporter permease [Cryobacterium sp. LW097]MEC5184711.1 raffinose/stachyose/melibiose transport system permease protein [Cryobacterium sp. MP_3.1]POH61443.1 carbohydrate ABC transporter permease [Cryobacterium zongtaii]POH62141.1 carbohydrate ABC transporter permease [Cryobacterium zongtaii]POH68001.1 carbohydrate ABC transporter permease [Cryobacterium zongtaii]